eukprot:TRINITY_DN2614_c0_g1_i1.p1 TRINITY_DN2614_c0_g1~~TRINITY_DN2614_c0_g1_i1.p1  ORF type:complete len:1239 (-),score=341.51 TRINITY_DN2614_c0_g1_i1:57-3773(-)
MQQYEAVFNYNAAGNFSKNGVSDITIRRGEILNLKEIINGGWILAQKATAESVVGYVPLNYLKKIEVNSNAPSPSPSPLSSASVPSDSSSAPKIRAVAKQDYEATGITINGVKDVSFKRDDVIVLLSKLPNGWTKGELGGKLSIFPVSHLRKYDLDSPDSGSPFGSPQINGSSSGGSRSFLGTSESGRSSPNGQHPRSQTSPTTPNTGQTLGSPPQRPPPRSHTVSIVTRSASQDSTPPPPNSKSPSPPIAKMTSPPNAKMTSPPSPTPTTNSPRSPQVPNKLSAVAKQAPSRVQGLMAPNIVRSQSESGTAPTKTSQDSPAAPRRPAMTVSGSVGPSPAKNTQPVENAQSSSPKPLPRPPRATISNPTTGAAVRPEIPVINTPTPPAKTISVPPMRPPPPSPTIPQRSMSRPLPPAENNAENQTKAPQEVAPPQKSAAPVPQEPVPPQKVTAPAPQTSVPPPQNSPNSTRQTTSRIQFAEPAAEVVPSKSVAPTPQAPITRVASPEKPVLPPQVSKPASLSSPEQREKRAGTRLLPNPHAIVAQPIASPRPFLSPPPQRPPATSPKALTLDRQKVSFNDNDGEEEPRLLALPTDEKPKSEPVRTLRVPNCSKCGKKGHFASSCEADDTEVQAEGITFTEHRGKAMIKAATLDKLIERLYIDSVGTTDSVSEYVDTFLMTYRTFVPARQLFQKLIETYNAYSAVTPDLEENSRRKVTRARIGNVFKKWVGNYYEDFEENPDMLEQYTQFIRGVKSTGNNESLGTVLQRAISRGEERQRRETVAFKEATFSVMESRKAIDAPQLSPILSDSFNFSDKDIGELAKQLSLMEFHLFKMITPKELLLKQWNSKSSMLETSPNLLKLIERFNQFSSWVSYMIVKEAALKKRVALVQKFIRLAKECEQLNNFNCVFEIISGLQQSSVYRLKKTWELIRKEKEHQMLEELVTLTGSTNSFSVYRGRLHSADPPCIPYLGVYQSDLTFIHDGNPDVLDNGYINFFKRRLVGEVIKEMQTYQQAAYYFPVNESIQKWFKQQELLNFDEETIYKVSLMIEPRESDLVQERQKGTKSLSGGRSLSRSSSGAAQMLKGLQHASWTAGSKQNKNSVSKLQHFFGEESSAFDFYKRWNEKPTETPKGILGDVEAAAEPRPRRESSLRKATSAIDLTPEQIEWYKKQQLEKYEQEMAASLARSSCSSPTSPSSMSPSLSPSTSSSNISAVSAAQEEDPTSYKHIYFDVGQTDA